MAQIRDYDTQISPVAPLPGASPERLRAQPEDFGGGQGLDQAGRGLADISTTLDRVAQQQDVTNATVQMAQARQKWTSELNQRYATSEAGDPNFASKFNNDFNTYMDSVGSNAVTPGGQAAFQRAKAELTATMVEKSAQLQVHSAGVAAKQSYLSVMDANSSTLVTSPDQFPSVMADADHMLNDPSGPYFAMGPDARAELQRQTHEQLALSAVNGNIKNDPEGTLKQLQDGKWDQWLKGPARNMAENSAVTAVRGQEIEQMRLDRAAEKADIKHQEVLYGQALKMLRPADGGPSTLTTPWILSQPIKPQLQEHLMSLVDRDNKPDPASAVSAATTTRLFAMMRPKPDGSSDMLSLAPVDDEFIAGNLSRTDHDWLTKKYQDLSTDQGARFGQQKQAFWKGITPQIDKSNPLMGKVDQNGPQNLYLFQRWADDQEAAYRAAGKDPRDLYNPAKPDYIGDPKMVEQFQKPFSESVKTMRQMYAPKTDRPSLDTIFKGK